jgi:Ca-activated chloride channel family protein
MLFCIIVSLLLSISPPVLNAQSGRQKKASTKQTAPTQSSDARARRVETTTSDSIDSPSTQNTTATTTPASSNTESHTGDAEDDVVRISSNLVTVPASVVDERGAPIINLKLEDFELRVDGQTKQINDLNRSDTPVRMALLFDNSQSLMNVREFEKQAAVKFFRNVMRPVDRAAIYSVATESVLVQPLTSDTSALVRTIERFGKPEGATSLLDAVADASAYLRAQQGRKVIVIVSDGVDTVSNIDFETSLRRAQNADCQLYVVQTGLYENANLRDLTAERRMQDFAGQTGGSVYIVKTSGDLDVAFAQISADLAQQYVLSYYAHDEPHDGRFHQITVQVRLRPNWRVRARKGYYAPKG